MVADPGLSRVERRKRATRERLLEAGREALAGPGVAGLSVQAITEEADVALGTFYNYFADKGALFEALLAEDLQVSLDVILEHRDVDDSPAVQLALATAVGTARNWVDRRRATYVYELSLAGFGPTAAGRAHLTRLLEEGVAADEFAPVPPAIAGAVYFGTMLEATRAIAHGELPDFDEAIEQVVRVVLRALGVSEPRLDHAVAEVQAREPAGWWPI